MAFFQRVMNYLLNEVLVNGLANRCAAAGALVRAQACGRRRLLHLCLAAPAAADRPRPLTRRPVPPPAPRPCSRTFQRFAIRSNAMMEEMAKKSAEQKMQLGQTAAEKGGHFWKVRERAVRPRRLGRAPLRQGGRAAAAAGWGAGGARQSAGGKPAGGGSGPSMRPLAGAAACARSASCWPS